MSRILTIFILCLFIGVIVAGSGVALELNPEEIVVAANNGIITYGMDINASFLAPMPTISYNVPVNANNFGFNIMSIRRS